MLCEICEAGACSAEWTVESIAEMIAPGKRNIEKPRQIRLGELGYDLLGSGTLGRRPGPTSPRNTGTMPTIR